MGQSLWYIIIDIFVRLELIEQEDSNDLFDGSVAYRKSTTVGGICRDGAYSEDDRPMGMHPGVFNIYCVFGLLSRLEVVDNMEDILCSTEFNSWIMSLWRP